MRDKNINFGRLLVVSIVAALGGLLFGFDIAIITGAGPFLTESFELNSIQEGWAYSSLLFGCIIGAAFAGRLSDAYGRKPILFGVALLFAVTSLGSGMAIDLTTLVIARIIGGFAVGAASGIAPLYISEISPSKVRGSLVSMYQLFIVTGILISYFINYLLRGIGDDNWRWMFASGAIPSFLFFVVLFFIPESPRYLVRKGFKEKAFAILKNIGGQANAEQQIKEIEDTLHDGKITFKSLFAPELRKVMLVGFLLAVLIQLSGINVVIDYAPKIFTRAGWDLDVGLFATFGLGLINFLSTWVSILIVDRFGRKPLYIIGSAGMSLALAGLAIAGFLNKFEGLLVLMLIIVFLISFSSSIGPVFWTYISEIFPNKVRGTAMSIPVFTQWIFNALIVLVFPAMLNKMHLGVTFSLILVFAVAQLFVAIVLMPETKGKSLEEIEKLWK